eukprot:808468-Prymnesium_polylepis.2
MSVSWARDVYKRQTDHRPPTTMLRAATPLDTGARRFNHSKIKTEDDPKSQFDTHVTPHAPRTRISDLRVRLGSGRDGAHMPLAHVPLTSALGRVARRTAAATP